MFVNQSAVRHSFVGLGLIVGLASVAGWRLLGDEKAYAPYVAAASNAGEQAIARLKRALDEYFVGGIRTNISLFRRIVNDPEFHAARLDTGFLDRMLERKENEKPEAAAADVAAVAAGIIAALGTNAPGAKSAATNGGSRAQQHESKWNVASRREALQ